MIQLEIFGRPVACNSTKYTNRNNSNHYYNPKQKHIDQAKWQLKAQFNKEPIKGAVSVDARYFFKVPKNTSSVKRRQMLNNIIKHTVRPDRGNLDKFMEDVLKGVVIEDDSLIWKYSGQKMWCESEKEEKTLIQIITY